MFSWFLSECSSSFLCNSYTNISLQWQISGGPKKNFRAGVNCSRLSPKKAERANDPPANKNSPNIVKTTMKPRNKSFNAKNFDQRRHLTLKPENVNFKGGGDDDDDDDGGDDDDDKHDRGDDVW